MTLSKLVSVHLLSLTLLLALEPHPAVAEPKGFGRALVFRLCGDFTQAGFCVCHGRLHNVPETAKKPEFEPGICKGATATDDPARLVPPNFPSMAEPETIQFLFVTLYGGGVMAPFCPYSKKCDAIDNEWRSDTWAAEPFRSIASISVIAALYGRSECLKAQTDLPSAKWAADLKELLAPNDRAELDAQLGAMAAKKLRFGGEDQTIIEAGCGIDPWHIYRQVKPK